MRLTEYSKSAGCAGKLAPSDLESAIQNLPRQYFRELLVGFEHSDDAGVFMIKPDVALVQTIDFFSPVVDNPYIFGQIAAANALSDVYAMGGEPRTALSVVCFPAKGLDFSILGEIMRGGMDKLHEAGVALLGGHSLRDDEVKFGYAITGIIDPRKIKHNRGARSGARILLTKPLGTGLITTALKREKAAEEHIPPAVNCMSELNRRAAQICLDHGIDTMTDVTGFGLIGHALEVARASRISIRLEHRNLPLLPGALEYSAAGFCAGGLESNREFYSEHVQFETSIAPEQVNLLFDPQTSGGLLVFVPEATAADLLAKLRAKDIPAADIGSTTEYGDAPILVC